MDKAKFDALRNAAKGRFDGAKTPDEIKAATEELANIDALEKEAAEIETQNAQLLASYKEIVKKEPISKKPEDDDGGDDEGEGLDFDEALAKIKAARKN